MQSRLIRTVLFDVPRRLLASSLSDSARAPAGRASRVRPTSRDGRISTVRDERPHCAPRLPTRPPRRSAGTLRVAPRARRWERGRRRGLGSSPNRLGAKDRPQTWVHPSNEARPKRHRRGQNAANPGNIGWPHDSRGLGVARRCWSSATIRHGKRMPAASLSPNGGMITTGALLMKLDEARAGSRLGR